MSDEIETPEDYSEIAFAIELACTATLGEDGSVRDAKGRYLNSYGRPTAYRPMMDKRVARMVADGATFMEVADELGVTRKTLYNWRQNFPSLATALEGAVGMKVKRLEQSLHDRATGFFYKEEQAIKVRQPDGSDKVEIHEVERFQPPSDVAIFFSLTNYAPDKWRHKTEKVHSGAIDVSHTDPDAARATIARYLERLKQEERSGETSH